MRYPLFVIVLTLAAASVWAEEKGENGENGEKRQEEQKLDPVKIPALVDVLNKECPVSGKPVADGMWVDWNGVRTRLCCEGCVKKFQKEPAKYLGKLGFEVVKVDGGKTVVDLKNKKCPGMGGEPKADIFGDHSGVRVHYCCPRCDAGVRKDFAPKIEAMGYRYIPAVVDLRNKLCPFSGEPVDGETSVDHDGIRVQLCCKGCIKKFQKDPAKTFEKLGVDPEKLKNG